MTDRLTAPAATAQPVLEVSDAHKSFGAVQALDGVSLALRTGEIVALLGPNGAGKTTLVRAICGRLALDSGTVRVCGADPRTSASARADLGLVPQDIALYPELTARENLEILGRLAGVKRSAIGPAVEKALDWTGLADRAADRVGVLSGGMRRRFNLAAGTLHEPRLLLLDEPTVGVDPRARDSIHTLLRELRDRGVAILLTTHDLEQAAELSDQVVIQNEGTVCAHGSVSELVAANFGKAREVRVRLAEAPSDSHRRLLEQEGLATSHDSDDSWSGPLSGGFESLGDLGRRLAEGGLVPDELRVREPGLRGVFFKLTGRELES